jgi:hypothetical protein
LRTRNATHSAISTLCESDILLLNLSAARGPKTFAALEAILERRRPDRPTILLAEGGSELLGLIETPVVRAVACSLSTGRDLTVPSVLIRCVGRERLQREQELRFALDGEQHSESDKQLARLFRAAWRSIWQRIDHVSDTFVRRALRDQLSEVGRVSATAADQFRLASRLVSEAVMNSAATVEERRLQIVAALADLTGTCAAEVLIITGDAADEAAVRQLLDGLTGPSVPKIRPFRHVSGSAETARAVICCGYWGPRTFDALIRSQAKVIHWVLDPVECGFAHSDGQRLRMALSRLSLDNSIGALSPIISALDGAGGSLRSADPYDHPELVDSPTEIRFSETFLSSNGREQADQVVEVAFSDGSVITAPDTLRFDIVRAGAPHPVVVCAKDLVEGDQVLVVRGDHQRTLSDLLLEDMDRGELREEAQLRSAWQSLCQAMAKTRRFSAREIARRVREQGGRATTENVRSWLRSDDASTPRDFQSFVALSAVLETGLPEETLRRFFDGIRRWRIAHRKRGRDVVRLLRLAWFGSLSATDLGRVEDRWGLGVRDLIEGSRVLEVEETRLSHTTTS